MLQWRSAFFSLVFLCLTGSDVLARSGPANLEPDSSMSPASLNERAAFKTARHTVNQVELAVTNRGVIGLAYDDVRDAFTNEVIFEGARFPRGSKREYIQSISLWMGARLNRGIAVSQGFVPGMDYSWLEGEFGPSDPPGEIVRRSTLELLGGPDPDAVSEEDFVCEYTDTLLLFRPWPWGPSQYTYPNPNPLGVRVRQESYAWSHLYAEDFVLINLRVRNISNRVLRDFYVGLHIRPLVKLSDLYLPCPRDPDEVCGYLPIHPAHFGCDYMDTLDLVWAADNDGDPYQDEFIKWFVLQPAPPGWQRPCILVSTRDVMGVRALQSPSADLDLMYNWWAQGWTDDDKLIQIRPTTDPDLRSWEEIDQEWRPTNRVDEDYYDWMAADEVDFPSFYLGHIARSPYDNYIVPNEAWCNALAGGAEIEELMSWGPLNLPPGSEFPLTFAVIGGEDFHTNSTILRHLPFRPDWFYRTLNFDDIAANARMAGWVYDNPGYDTDGDGYAGDFRVCLRDSALIGGNWVANYPDTQWYRGDGIADFRAAQPPTRPEFRLTPVPDGIHVSFNGEPAETERDVFFQRNDFEGYRIYLGRDERDASFSLVAAYDRENFDKLEFNKHNPGGPIWELHDAPFTKRELRCQYSRAEDPCNDTTFDPYRFTEISPYRHPDFPNDSVFAFVPHSYNASELGVTSPITRVYPDAIDPRTIPDDSITADMLTEEGYLKFFEYEFTITDLLATVPYCVNVTAFDFGSPKAGLTPFENARSEGFKTAYPLGAGETPEAGTGDVYVYPNPYRVDADYRSLGYEGRNQDDRWDERVRAIWFANLPPKCTISIYTIDGDRVRTLKHDMSPSDPMHRRHRWSLINRNLQLVQSGLYYWVVESDDGRVQMGKLVIIR